MICQAIEPLALMSHRLHCASAGGAGLAGGALALAVVALVGVWSALRAKGRRWRLAGAFAALAALSLGLAAGLPEAVRDRPVSPGGRVAVLLDLSESVRRDGDSRWNAAREALADRLDEASQPLEGPWSGRVFGFGAVGAPLSAELPLPSLPQTVRSAAPGPVAQRSALAEGLSTALDWVEAGIGGGALYLLTDGWASGADPMIQANRAAGRGVPIHVMATGSSEAGRGLLSWNLGPVQFTGQEGIARLNILGGGRLDWSLDGHQGTPLGVPASDIPRPVRLPLAFVSRGISHVALRFGEAGQGGQSTTLYTLVRGPARVLVYGGAGWVDDLSPERYRIHRASPQNEEPAAGFDAVVIDALSPVDFPDGFVERLLGAVAGGTGVLIENGPRRDPDTEPQRIADWEASALGPVLPVNSDPETYLAEPPPRNVLIIIDTSGSMVTLGVTGKAIEIASHILTFLRPLDQLTILPFSSDVGQTFTSGGLTPAERARADGFLRAMPFGGGTNMSAAVIAAAQLRGAACDLFVISDGDYPPSQVNVSPICRTTAIGVAGLHQPGFDTSWGESIALRPGQNVPNITFETFAPEPRITFWSDGPHSLLVDDAFAPIHFDTPIRGLALTYPRPNADIAALASTLPRPLALAFRRDPRQRTINTAVFLGEIPDRLPAASADAILDRLVVWSDPDRYDIALQGEGEAIDLRVSIADGLPPPTVLSGSVQFADGRSIGLNLRPSELAGEFVGRFTVPRQVVSQRALLTLEESAQSVQTIPVTFPASGAVSNMNFSSGSEREIGGVNEPLLRQIAVATGGYNLAIATPGYNNAMPERPPILLWPFLCALGLGFFALALWLGGSRR